jgi:hypothetical protein
MKLLKPWAGYTLYDYKYNEEIRQELNAVNVVKTMIAIDPVGWNKSKQNSVQISGIQTSRKQKGRETKKRWQTNLKSANRTG